MNEREIVRVEVIACVTDQWNFPHPRNRPWVSDEGLCSICGQPVEHERLEPIRPFAHTAIAKPHTRVQTWYTVPADELDELE